jgi:hypothetical protein
MSSEQIKQAIIAMCESQLKVKKDKAEAAIEKSDIINTIMKIHATVEETASVSSAGSGGDLSKKIETCRHNIELWQKKLDDGKAKDSDKQSEKIAKEEKKLEKLLAKSEPKADKPVAEKKPKVEKAKPAAAEKVEKRIKRFSSVMADALKATLERNSVEYTDKLKKEYLQYVEELAEDDYKKGSTKDHMDAFAKLKAPVEEEEMRRAEEPDEEEDVVESADTTVKLTLPELQKINTIATLQPSGLFWDADNGRNVEGPDADEDEDVDEVTFESKKYVVGAKTGRVYEVLESGDKFVGFFGVGAFRTMKK